MKKTQILIMFILMLVLLASCKKQTEIDDPKDDDGSETPIVIDETSYNLVEDQMSSYVIVYPEKC